jgi:ketosteroid isomerase-like protein
MVRTILIAMTTLLSASVCAQDFQKEINDQVWRPFIASFNSFDTDGFMAVHSRDVVRSPRDVKVLLSWDEYFKQQQAGDKRQKENGGTRLIELRFTERIANTKQAIDVGIYKTTVSNKEGKTSSFYGRFHVVLCKEGSEWKILVDTDSSEGNTISEKDFLAASPL